MFTEAYLEPSRTSTMEPLSLWLNHILKTDSVRSYCLLGSIFYTTCEKTYHCENFGRKILLLTIEFFFSEFEITQWSGIINKGFLNQDLLKVLKLLHFLFYLFQILLSKHIQKVKVKKRCCFRRCCFHQIKWAFFLHVSNVLGMYRGVYVQSHASYAEA